MLIAIVAPELILSIELRGLMAARSFLNHISRLGVKGWTLTHLQFAANQGFSYTSQQIYSKQVVKLIESGVIRNPPISAEELNDRSKSNAFIKIIALTQILWFGFQTLFRAVNHLQITALEISVISFILCSSVTYGLCWNMPQDVQYPVELQGEPIDGPIEEAEIDDNYTEGVSVLIMAVFAALFGGAHCLAWNSPFPTPHERLAWRICAGSMTGLGPMLALLQFLSEFEDVGTMSMLMLLITVLGYTVARIALIVLAFMALRALPTDADQSVAWNSYIPHWGL